MTKLEEDKKCCEPAEVSKDWLKKENTRLHEENHKMKIIINLLLEKIMKNRGDI